MVVSGVPRATVVLPSKVAQGTIAHTVGARAGRTGADGATAGPGARHAMWGTKFDPLGMCTLPMV